MFTVDNIYIYIIHIHPVNHGNRSCTSCFCFKKHQTFPQDRNDRPFFGRPFRPRPKSGLQRGAVCEGSSTFSATEVMGPDLAV